MRRPSSYPSASSGVGLLFLFCLLDVCVLQTQIVIKDYEEAYHRQAPTTNRDVTGLGLRPKDSDVLLRILCHRADREASKFLKTVYNLPKH